MSRGFPTPDAVLAVARAAWEAGTPTPDIVAVTGLTSKAIRTLAHRRGWTSRIARNVQRPAVGPAALERPTVSVRCGACLATTTRAWGDPCPVCGDAPALYRATTGGAPPAATG